MSALPHNTFSPPPPEPPTSSHHDARAEDMFAAQALAEERRRSARLKQKFVTQMTPWEAGHASVPVEVVINDLSEDGVGIIHDQPLEIGLRNLVTVPRDKAKPITREYRVIRCDRRHDGQYLIGLKRSDAVASVAAKP